MTTDPRPATERAAELRTRIMETLNSGRFSLTIKGGYTSTNGRPCGCAVGAAAVAMGAPAAFGRMEISKAISSLVNYDESWALEDGFEGRPRSGLSGHQFYALGVELRALAEKAAP